MSKLKTLLWLDDSRDPFDTETDWLIFTPIGRNIDVIWVKNYQEFINWIIKNGLPDGICFDHDLADGTFKEKTGYDCAMWLVQYCLDRKITIPVYNIQSANPIGRENIRGLLNNYVKFFNDNLK